MKYLKKLIIITCLIIFYNVNILPVYAKDTENLLNIGKSFYREGKYYQSIKNLQSAVIFVDNYEDIYDAHLYLGLSYYMIKSQKYIESFQNAINANPLKELDPSIFSPKIVEIYNEIKKSTLKEQKKIDILSSSFKKYISAVQEKNTYLFFEYNNTYRKIENSFDGLDLEMNYQTELLKFDYGVNKVLSLNFAGGLGNTKYLNKNSNSTFTYQAGAKISLPLINNFKLLIEIDQLNLKNEITDLKLKMKWQELRTGVKFLYSYAYVVPFFGIYNVNVKSTLDFLPEGYRKTNLVNNASKNKSEYLAGIKTNISDYIIEGEIRATDLGTLILNMDSFRLGIGKVF